MTAVRARGRSAGLAEGRTRPARGRDAGRSRLPERRPLLPAAHVRPGNRRQHAGRHGDRRRSTRRSDVVVGNLICHRGSIISQSTLFLDKFEQIEVLRERAETALAANPRDAAAIRDLAEMRRLEGDLPEAVRMLKQAYEIDPADPLTRDMLADCLLEALAGELRRLSRRLAALAQNRLSSAAANRICCGSTRWGSTRPARGWKRSPPIFDWPTPRRRNRCRCRLARSTRPAAIAGFVLALNALWADSSAGERSEISRQLDERKRDWASPPAVNQLRTYLAHFGGLPGTDEVRLRLAHELLDRRELLDAEIELLQLERSSGSPSFKPRPRS